jgi:hypothetical protein
MKLRVASLSATSKAASLLRFARTLLEPMLNPWLRLGLKAFQIGLEAQSVMALRLLRLAAGGARAEAEASRMVGEKILAAGEAQATTTAAAMRGHKKRGVAGKALNVYRKRIRANTRRLSGR